MITDLKRSFKIEINALNFIFGGQLVQRNEQRRFHPMIFFLKKLYKLKLNYFIYNKELITIIESFK